MSLVENENFDVMVFSETKLCGKEKRIIKGYKSFELNRNTRAGGVIVYYKKVMNVDLKNFTGSFLFHR